MHPYPPPHPPAYPGQPIGPEHYHLLPFAERIRYDASYKLKWRKRIIWIAAVTGIFLAVGISIATYIGFKVVTSDTSKKMIGAAQGAAENTANEIALDVERQKKALEYRAENPDAVTASDVQEPTTTDMMKELAIEAAKAELAD